MDGEWLYILEKIAVQWVDRPMHAHLNSTSGVLVVSSGGIPISPLPTCRIQARAASPCMSSTSGVDCGSTDFLIVSTWNDCTVLTDWLIWALGRDPPSAYDAYVSPYV